MARVYPRRSLVVQLLLLSAAAATLPAVLIALVLRTISSDAILESIQQQQTELARRLSEEVNDEVRHAQGFVALVAHSSFFAAGSRIDQYEALRNLLRECPAFQEAMYVGPAGQELLKVSQSGTPSRLGRRIENLRSSYIGSPFFSSNRSPTILLGEPLRSFANPNRSGAVMAKMSFTTLGALLRQAKIGTRGEAFIVDSKGNLLAHPNEERVLAHANESRLPVVQEWLAQPDTPTRLVRFHANRQTELLAMAYPIPLLRSAVIIQQPRADVYAPLVRMQNRLILCTALSVIVFLAVAVGVAWRILKPLRLLRAAAEQIGQGNTDVHLDIRTHDELEELGQTFEKMAKSLGELERMRRDLIHMIVHDLKMPLSTILPSLENLLTEDAGPLGSEQRHFVQMARRSGQEMLMLIQNLLDVAKMEEGKLNLHPEPFTPHDWARSVVSGFEPLAHAANKQLTLTSDTSLDPIQGDIALLSRVLGNLISNALRHISAVTGEVAVSLFRDGNQLAVEVRDNGEGIPEKDLARIFDKFVQSQDTRVPVRGGTGLGLTFCKMVVEAHGGRIHVHSQPGQGSVFTVYLPFNLVCEVNIQERPLEQPHLV